MLALGNLFLLKLFDLSLFNNHKNSPFIDNQVIIIFF